MDPNILIEKYHNFTIKCIPTLDFYIIILIIL